MASKTEILVYIDWYLPGYRAGGPIRSLANMVEHLKESCRFHILTRDRDYLSPTAYDGLVTDKWVEGGHGERIFYCSPEKMGIRHFRRALSELSYDHVYINGLFSWHFSIKPLRIHRREDVSLTIAPRGMLRSSALAIKGPRKKLFLGIARRLHLYDKVRFHATDEREVEDITRVIASNASICLAPNLPRPRSEYRPPTKVEGHLKLVFFGRIAPENNLLFALQLLSKMDGFMISLDIFGARYDEDYWKRCKKVIESLGDNIKVDYLGTVPSQLVIATLQRYDALFLPTKGENFGHVILESWMASRPVLISDETPWSDLDDDQGGRDIPLKDIEAFRDTMIQWSMMDNERWSLICRAAFRKGMEYADDPSVIEKTEALFSLR